MTAENALNAPCACAPAPEGHVPVHAAPCPLSGLREPWDGAFAGGCMEGATVVYDDGLVYRGVETLDGSAYMTLR